MAERLGLLTIIVLGEFVVGVVDSTTEAGPVALTIGFGFSWDSFDFVGRRVSTAVGAPSRHGCWPTSH